MSRGGIKILSEKDLKGIGERIKHLRKILNLSQVDFAKLIFLSQSRLSEIEKGKGSPSGPTIKAICEVFGVSENWLLTGEGEMFVKKPRWLEEKEEMEAIAKEIGATIVEPVPVLGYIPAGFPEEIPEDAIIEWVHLPELPKGCFVLKAKGDSMTPVIKEGDYLVIKPTYEAFSGNIVICQNEWGENTIKRLKRKGNKYYLVPENPEYPTLEFDPEKHKIIGRVLTVWRRFKIEEENL